MVSILFNVKMHNIPIYKRLGAQPHINSPMGQVGLWTMGDLKVRWDDNICKSNACEVSLEKVTTGT